jgi:AcrR family transcriptional regulator
VRKSKIRTSHRPVAKTSHDVAEVDLNKHGQVLGSKGRRTRARLMDCGRDLLVGRSPTELTVGAIAEAAKLSVASYYLYFDDVSDLLYELSCAASHDLAEVHRHITESWSADVPVVVNVRRFVDAFVDTWDAHRSVLLYRDLEADRGDERFAELRIKSNTPIIAALGARIYAAGLSEQRCSKGDARIEALLFLTALSGCAKADPERGEQEFGLRRIYRVLANSLTRTLEPESASSSICNHKN